MVRIIVLHSREILEIFSIEHNKTSAISEMRTAICGASGRF